MDKSKILMQQDKPCLLKRWVYGQIISNFKLTGHPIEGITSIEH